jgi:hypothetical protein
MPEAFKPKPIKQQAEEWWAGTVVVDPLRPARWKLSYRGELLNDSYPLFFDEDHRGPFGTKPAV